jgi:hypothetical protein
VRKGSRREIFNHEKPYVVLFSHWLLLWGAGNDGALDAAPVSDFAAATANAVCDRAGTANAASEFCTNSSTRQRP